MSTQPLLALCKILFFVYAITQLLACAQTPTQRVIAVCPNCQPQLFNTNTAFTISTLSNNIHPSSKKTVHIYLEGDGLPWSPRGYINQDPNSRSLTSLNLMIQDPKPSIYLNRPCYGHDVMPENCKPIMWTMARYSKATIDVMNNTLDQIKSNLGVKNFVLIGHSGGGTIAMLIANKRQDITAVITLASNLDHSAWTQHFNYKPLDGSLNPTQLPPLPQAVIRWHFAGGSDKQVPPELVKEAAEKDSYAKFFLKEGYDHQCCWKRDWQQVLKDLELEIKPQINTAR